MKRLAKMIAAAAMLAAAIAIYAPGPGASSEHFVFLNDNDYYGSSSGNDFATAFRLQGTLADPLLKQAALLDSGQPSVEVASFVPTVQVVRAGANTCIFMADSNGPESLAPNEITSFKYPSMTPVGSFSDPTAPSPELAIIVAAHGGYLFAAYNGYQNVNYLATWRIESGCTLHLVWMSPALSVVESIEDMAVTPDGKTLVVSMCGLTSCCVASYSIAPDGALTEHGPYGIAAQGAGGVDITADSKYAIFVGMSYCSPTCYNQINVAPINSDGSLGLQYVFGGDGTLGLGDGGWPWLSPNEKFLYESGSDGEGRGQVRTFNFSESPLSVTYSGCQTSLRPAPGEPAVESFTLATEGATGTGGAVYIAEVYDVPSIAVLTVNATTGCTTEAPASPFVLSDASAATKSLVAYPPRPF
jgi:hypothetical protein